MVIVDDSSDGDYARPEMGTIVVKIYRCKVTGPWEGKWEPPKHSDTRPILVSEKAKELEADTRVGYCPVPHYCNYGRNADISFSEPTTMKAVVKPQSTEWIDDRDGPPFVEFTFFYRSQG